MQRQLVDIARDNARRLAIHRKPKVLVVTGIAAGHDGRRRIDQADATYQLSQECLSTLRQCVAVKPGPHEHFLKFLTCLRRCKQAVTFDRSIEGAARNRVGKKERADNDAGIDNDTYFIRHAGSTPIPPS
jgi:hypothetical protein